MSSADFLKAAKQMVCNYLGDYHGVAIPDERVFIVWYCKELQNHKAILGGHTPDLLLFEVTYNGDKNEFYFDGYQKIHHHVSPC